MKPKLHTQAETIENLNKLLQGELSAVETYDQAIKNMDNTQPPELIANRDCHRRRVHFLGEQIIQHGGQPTESSGLWGSFASLVAQSASIISPGAAIAALEEGEDRGLMAYLRPDDLDPVSMDVVATVLLPRQQETHARMSECKANYQKQ